MTAKSHRNDGRLKIAIQKSGRLSEKSFALLEKAGISLQKSKDQELNKARLMISQKDEELSKTKDDLIVAQQAERNAKSHFLASTRTSTT